MTQDQGLRRRSTLTYRWLVNTTLVNALRSVFNEDYPDQGFQKVWISTEFPLERVAYPAIQVRYDGRAVRAAGVGHAEQFKDKTGVFRDWDHRRFEGSVELTVVALSPLDRDLLADAVMEVLTMGRMDDHLSRFFWTVYGEPTDEKQSFTSNIFLNTDEIHDGGGSVSPAPWQPEDVLVYQTSLTVDVVGSFYSLVRPYEIAWVWRVNQEPYPQGEQAVSINYRPDLAWTPPSEYADTNGFATGTAQISATESYP